MQCSRLEKIVIPQLHKISLEFYGNQMSISIFTTAPHNCLYLKLTIPIYAFPIYYFKIHFNIILPFTSISLEWSLFFGFPT